jgi:hypothetical protein
MQADRSRLADQRRVQRVATEENQRPLPGELCHLARYPRGTAHLDEDGLSFSAVIDCHL